MTALPLPGPEKGYCEGAQDKCGADGCPKFGKLGRPANNGNRRVAGCKDPVARGRRSVKSGKARQRRAAVSMGIVPVRNEEQFHSLFQNEIKSGSQVGPAWTWWQRCEAQARASEPEFGNRRKPMRVILEPSGTSDGIVMVRESTWREIVTPAVLHFYGEP